MLPCVIPRPMGRLSPPLCFMGCWHWHRLCGVGAGSSASPSSPSYPPSRALQFPPEGWLRLSLNNGSITHLVVRPDGRVALRALGDTGFMPPDKISRS